MIIKLCFLIIINYSFTILLYVLRYMHENYIKL